MTQIAEKLNSVSSKALVEEHALNFIWKGPKKILEDGTIEQTQKILKNCSLEELTGFKNHCEQMLYNNDSKNPGRFNVKREINEQIIKCNAELFLRERLGANTSRFMLLDQIRKLLMDNDIKMVDLEGYTLKDIISTPLEDYAFVPVSVVIDACLDRSGLFSRKHLTTTFILKQGLWLTAEEYAEHEEHLRNKSKKEKEEYFKKILNVNKKHSLRINSSGLSLTQMKEALAIRDMKYTQMSTEKLRLLRDYFLFLLIKDVDNHIKQWTDILSKIELVINLKSNVESTH